MKRGAESTPLISRNPSFFQIRPYHNQQEIASKHSTKVEVDGVKWKIYVNPKNKEKPYFATQLDTENESHPIKGSNHQN